MNNGIFLAHINEDKPKVRILRDRLRAEGFRTWMDEDDNFPGEDWEQKIEKAIANAGLALTRTGFSGYWRHRFAQKYRWAVERRPAA